MNENKLSQDFKKNSTLEFSKKSTSIAKGIAIIMLLTYHCFRNIYYYNLFDINFVFLSQSSAIYLCESTNICVGIFAFLSAFGLTRLYGKSDDKKLFSIKRILKLLGFFFILYVLLTFPTMILTGFNPYGEGFAFFGNMIADILCLGGFLGTPFYLGSFWYMSFAILIILLTPITINLYEKFGISCMALYLIPVLFFPNFFSADGLTNMTRWLLTIPFGVIFAKENILERLKGHNLTKSKWDKLIKLVIATLILVFLVKFRTSNWCEKYFFYIISTISPVFFTYYIFEFLEDLPKLNTLLSFFGKHSGNMFIIHEFVRRLWFLDFTYSLMYPILILGFVFITSLVISIIIEFIKEKINYNQKVNIFTDKILSLLVTS